MRKNIVFAVLILTLIGFVQLTAQINSNAFLEKDINQIFQSPEAVDSSYLTQMEFILSDPDNKILYGLDIFGAFKNSAVSPYQVYNDRFHYLVSPFGHYKFNDQVTLDVRGNIENKKDDLVYAERAYWSDELAGHYGGFEIAKITYNSDHFFVKYGRDYFLQGKYFYENLLFSKYNYPYDQLVYGLKNDYFELSSYYLSLNSLRENNDINIRHLNGHRLSVNLQIGYLAFNEVILYGGENRQINLALFNPLLIYYSYQKNARNFESNSLVSAELYLYYRDYFFFGEFLLDDFQIDKDVPDDLEPTEWGMNVTIGKNKLIENLNWKLNYTRVANRTYNAPIKDYEKFVYKNYPIGHFFGNNFWEIKSSLTYIPSEKLWMELTLSHLEYGDEALYSPFNKDYLNYTVEEG
ncbi:MAG TPA: hypothetical protein ENO27_03835, partial [Caldithrix sp.]|nr:hypothetical protein [Caldithrix sp.]